MRMTDKYIVMQCQSSVSSGLYRNSFVKIFERETGPGIRKRCAIFKYCEQAVVGEGRWQGAGGGGGGARDKAGW